MVSATDLAKRNLVTLIKYLAGIYSVSADVKRDSGDDVLKAAYRTVSRKAHPDRGGKGEDQQKLNDAYEKWCLLAKGKTSKRGPRKGAAPQTKPNARQRKLGGLGPRFSLAA